VISRLLLAGVVAMSTGTVTAPPGNGTQSATPEPDRLHATEVTAMVSTGHKWLIDHQNKDGSFSMAHGMGGKEAPVAVTALCALSLMAAGNLPDRGGYDRAVKRAIDWLVDHCNDDGYFEDDRDQVSKMHGDGYALLALTQAVGMYGSDDAEREQLAKLRGAIERGVSLIERTQGDYGGWYYEPKKVADHENSITVCMIQALRAARDVGFHVRSAVINDAVKYVKSSQDTDTGKFRYALKDQKTSWALTAAALSTLNALGDYGSTTWQKGFEALQRDDPMIGVGEPESFQEYGALYAAQAYWQGNDQHAFDRWWTAFVAHAAEIQRSDGSFPGGDYGAVYGTAIATLTLQVPLGYLPIFQR
jgi:hypothetical protein